MRFLGHTPETRVPPMRPDPPCLRDESPRGGRPFLNSEDVGNTNDSLLTVTKKIPIFPSAR